MTEAPPAPPPTNTPPNPSDQAQQIFNPIGGTPPSPSPEPKEEATPPVQQPEPGKKKIGLDKMGSIKKPEPPKEQVAPTKETPPTKEENLAILRKRAEQYEAELQKLKPEYEKLKPEYEMTKAELAKLKAMGLNDQERKEYELYRQLNAVEAVRQSQDFQQKIIAPIQKRISGIKSVAQNANLDDAQTGALLQAVDIQDGFKRNKALRAILQSVELDPSDFEALASRAMKLADELNEEWYPKEDEAMAKAQEVQLAARANQKKQEEEGSRRSMEEIKKAHEEVYRILATDKLKVVLDEPDLAIEGITMADAMQGAEPATTPQDRAFEAQAAAALPFVLMYAQKQLERAEQLSHATKLRNGTAPDRGMGGSKQTPQGEPQLTAEEVFRNTRGIR